MKDFLVGKPWIKEFDKTVFKLKKKSALDTGAKIFISSPRDVHEPQS